MKDIILLGSGGHAKSIVDAIEQNGEFKIAGFIDNISKSGFEYRGYKIIGTDKDLEKIYALGIHYAFVCVGYLGKGIIRDNLYRQLKGIGYVLPVIIDGSSTLATDVEIGEGTFVGKNAVINANAVVGKMAIINSAAVIEHDCYIGEFTHIAVAAVICGMTRIGTHTLIGANVTAIQNINIGDNCQIGAGSIIREDIDNNMIVVGEYKYHMGG